MFLGSPWEPRPSGRSGACSAKWAWCLWFGVTQELPLPKECPRWLLQAVPAPKPTQEIKRSAHTAQNWHCAGNCWTSVLLDSSATKGPESQMYLPTTLIFTVFSLFFSAGQSKDSPSRIPNSLLWSHHPSDFIGEGAILADAPACSQNSKHLLCKWFSDSLPGCERCHNNDNYRMAIGSSELPKFHLTLVY